ncbi:MAG: SurA N-terminal domain-containing protein [Myxococcales bacterium]|nr:SurA N-terminal domain-containing protein [Myxococcales bacterium]
MAIRMGVSIATCAITWLPMGTATAQPRKVEVIERVAAVINDEAIFLSELRRRAVPFLPQVMSSGSSPEKEARLQQLYRELLDRMVDEELLQQAARRMKIRVTRQEVEQAIRNMRSQSGLDEAQFWEAVRAQGFQESAYRKDMRRQLMQLKVMNQRARGRVNITEDDVRRRYEEQAARASRTLRFKVSHIFYPVTEEASATEVKSALEHIQRLRARATTDNFEEVASEGAGGDLGWLVEGDLPQALESTLLSMATGTISDPVRSPNGFHVLFLRERDRGQGSLPPYEEAREAIYREMADQAMRHQQTVILDELRREAVIEKKL